MKIDLRCFDYALEPLRRKRGWELQAARHHLARAEERVREARAALQGLRDAHEAQSQRASRMLADALDAGSYPRALAWLAAMRRRIREAERALAEHEVERARSGEECVALQRKVEAIERHREEALAEYSQVEQARQASEADREWLSRKERA